MKNSFLFTLPVLLSLAFGNPAKGQELDTATKISTAMENVHIFDDAFYMPQLDRYRRIWIYLPPDYETSGKHYPVLYMHDGQNLFDDLTSFVGEWYVDEILNEMHENGFKGLIVVGIEHGVEERLNELSPWKHPVRGGGLGEAYTAFIAETLKPAIDKNFRTLPGREHTGTGGSSMGGLISLYAALKYPEVFSRCLSFSPAFWFSEESYAFTKNTPITHDFRMFFLAGGKEYEERSVPEATEKMIAMLRSQGLIENQYRYVDDPEGKHNETFWKSYFAEAVTFLFAED